jgi:hypothetical protein
LISALLAAVLLLLVPTAAASDGAVELAHQATVVSQLARQAAAARDGAAGRREVAAAMALYRSEAEKLAKLQESELALEMDEVTRSQKAAAQALTEALATGKEASASRAVLGSWLDPLSVQVAVMDRALGSAHDETEPGLRRDLLLDIAERAGLVALVASYDVSRLASDGEQARLRARTLRRDTSGMGQDIGALMEARRSEERAADLHVHWEEASQVRDAAQDRELRSIAALEVAP